jgi:hypothetical protein
MSEQKTNSRAEQARINGAKSKGPTSDVGKAISSMNALKHGRFSQHLTVHFEDDSELPIILDELVQQFNPQTPAELRVVRELAGLTFLQERLTSMQTKYWEAIWMENRHEYPEERYPAPHAGLAIVEESVYNVCKYMTFIDRRLSNVLTNRARLLRLLKSYQRDFQAQKTHSGPKPKSTVQPIETEDTYPPPTLFETNPIEPQIPPLPKAA